MVDGPRDRGEECQGGGRCMGFVVIMLLGLMGACYLTKRDAMEETLGRGGISS